MKFVAIIFVVASVLAALFQVGGRLAAYNLDTLESYVAVEFRRFNVEVEGITGGWRYLDPVFRADEMRFQFGYLKDVEMELDLISTLMHDELVARRFSFSDGFIVFDKTPAGWRLKSEGEILIDFDYVSFARLAGRLKGQLALEFHDGDHVDRLFVAGTANNAERHRFDVTLRTNPDCASCTARVVGDLASRGPIDGALRIDVEQLEVLHHSLASGLVLNGNVLMVSRGGDFSAAAELGLVTGDSGTLTTRAVAAGSRQAFQGEIIEAKMDDESFFDASPGFAWDDGRWVVWLPEIHLEDASQVALDLLGEDHELADWIKGLALRGVVREPMAVVDDSMAFSGIVDLDEIKAYRGVPAAQSTRLRIAGGLAVMRAEIDGGPRLLDFPDVFPSSWALDGASGEMIVRFESDYLGIRGNSLTVTLADSYVRGGYALARPADRMEVRVTVDASVVRSTVAAGREFIPLGLAPDLESWLRASLLDGDVQNGRVIYHGHGRKIPDAVSRQFEMAAEVTNGSVRYHEDWPVAHSVDGRVLVATAGTFASGSGASFGTSISELAVAVLPKTNLADVRFESVSDVATILEFVRATPLAQQLPFVHPSWDGLGDVGLGVDLTIPLNAEVNDRARYAVDFELEGNALALGDYALEFSDLEGAVSYRSPDTITSETLSGRLFDEPVEVTFRTDERTVVELSGAMQHDHVLKVIGSEDIGILEGSARFEAALVLLGDDDPTLTIESDLVGMAIELPLPLGKPASGAADFVATMAFLPERTAVGLKLDESSGWLHFVDGAIARGSIGAGTRAEVADIAGSRVELTGTLEELNLAEAMAESGTFDWQFNDLRVERIRMGDFSIDDALLNGISGVGITDFELTSQELDGFVRRTGDEPWRLHLTSVRLPDDDPDETEEIDPLEVDMVADWVDVDVVIDDVKVGLDDYGAWSFDLRRRPGGVELTKVKGSIRGLTIESEAPVFWDTRTNRTAFEGTVTASDVGPVLEAWDFVPSAASERFIACGDIAWPGSPIWFDFDHLSGRAFVEINEGQLQDIEQGAGATKLLSLINFSTFTKRLNFDFSDVFGGGISFDYVTADVSMDDGVALFVEPVLIAGSGARININGTVDLSSATLDNEMIVTLPIRQSLPWYAAALLPVTPTGAAGVLLGRRLFREQIEALSSVKYIIGGTYDEPEVELVEMFTNTLADETTNEEVGNAVGCRKGATGASGADAG